MRPATKTILLVDDEEASTTHLKEYFSQELRDLCRCLTAVDGRKAVEVMEQEHVDLVITSLNMPNMDGFELMAYLRKNFPHVPFVVSSVYRSQKILEKVLEKGALLFILKPFRPDDLDEKLPKIKKALGLHVVSSDYMGHVKGISLSAFLHLLDLHKRTCKLTLKESGHHGELFFVDGRVVHAVLDDDSGTDSAVKILLYYSSKEDFFIENWPETVNKDLAQ